MPTLTEKFEHVLHIASRPYPKDLASRMVLLKLLDWNGLFAWTCWFLIAGGTYWWPFPTLHNCEVVYYSMTLWLYDPMTLWLSTSVQSFEACNWHHDRPHCAAIYIYILHTVPLVANWLRLHCLVHAAKALRTQLAPSRQPLRCAAEALVAWQSCFQLFCKCWLVMAGSFKTFQVQVFVCCINVYFICIYSILFFGFVIFLFSILINDKCFSRNRLVLAWDFELAPRNGFAAWVFQMPSMLRNCHGWSPSSLT